MQSDHPSREPRVVQVNGSKNSTPLAKTAKLPPQPGDEWKLEQGMVGAELPLLDLSLDSSDSEESVDEPPEKVVPFKGDPKVVFKEEKEGWRG